MMSAEVSRNQDLRVGHIFIHDQFIVANIFGYLFAYYLLWQIYLDIHLSKKMIFLTHRSLGVIRHSFGAPPLKAV